MNYEVILIHQDLEYIATPEVQ